MAKEKAKWQRSYSAGGIVYRQSPEGVEVVLIHPNKWNSQEGTGQWGLPKGLYKDGESPEIAAVREVQEETGVTGEIIQRIGEVKYFFKWQGENIFKTVQFYLMKYVSGEAKSDGFEIHEARFVPLTQALTLLTRKNEREIMEKAKECLEK